MVDNSVHVHINGFGNENTEYISQDFAVRCLEKGARGIMPMLEQIFFNEQHTENHNVRLRSLKNMLVEVFERQATNAENINITHELQTNACSSPQHQHQQDGITSGNASVASASVNGSGKWVTQGFHDTVDQMIVKSSGEICKEALHVFPINTSTIDNVSTNMNEIRNLRVTMERRLKEKTKAKLVERQRKTPSLSLKSE